MRLVGVYERHWRIRGGPQGPKCNNLCVCVVLLNSWQQPHHHQATSSCLKKKEKERTHFLSLLLPKTQEAVSVSHNSHGSTVWPVWTKQTNRAHPSDQAQRSAALIHLLVCCVGPHLQMHFFYFLRWCIWRDKRFDCWSNQVLGTTIWRFEWPQSWQAHQTCIWHYCCQGIITGSPPPVASSFYLTYLFFEKQTKSMEVHWPMR